MATAVDITLKNRTLEGIRLQVAMYTGRPYTPPANTTLNEKLAIQANAVYGADVYPRVGYFVIGDGGHRNSQTAEGKPYQSELQHQANAQAPFNLRPLVMRPVSNPLNATERAPYRLRRIENHNGNDYEVWYAKVGIWVNDTPEINITTVNDGSSSTVPYEHTSSDLSPTPLVASSNEVVTVTGDYYTVRQVFRVEFTEFDVNELINVAQILDGDARLAIISELGIVSGMDRQVQGTTYQGGTFNYTEVIAAQIGVHISTYRAVGTANEGFQANYNLGGTEPIYGLTAVK